jgi:hypothetical protein
MVLAQLTMIEKKERATESEGQKDTEIAWPKEL